MMRICMTRLVVVVSKMIAKTAYGNAWHALRYMLALGDLVVVWSTAAAFILTGDSRQANPGAISNAYFVGVSDTKYLPRQSDMRGSWSGGRCRPSIYLRICVH
jgi:hypothetical protein